MTSWTSFFDNNCALLVVKELIPSSFIWYLWRPNIRACTWSAKVWPMYDQAGIWSQRGENSRSTYGVEPLLASPNDIEPNASVCSGSSQASECDDRGSWTYHHSPHLSNFSPDILSQIIPCAVFSVCDPGRVWSRVIRPGSRPRPRLNLIDKLHVYCLHPGPQEERLSVKTYNNI